MVIVKILGGFASQLEKYIFAYKIAQEKRTELVLDVSEYLNGYFRPFMLDYLSLPNCRIVDGTEGLANVRRIDNGKDLINAYESENFPNIYLYKEWQDYTDFVAKYSEYEIDYNWEIFDHVSLNTPSLHLESFKKEIKGQYSVAVHVRRGDFVTVGWDNSIDDYKSLIGHILSKQEKAKFYFFSNDIDWVKKQLGKNERFTYMQNDNGVLGDIEDFFCMAECTQRILSSVSGYGKYANILNWHSGGREEALSIGVTHDLQGITSLQRMENVHIVSLSNEECCRGLDFYNKTVGYKSLKSNNIVVKNEIIKDSNNQFIQVIVFDRTPANNWIINDYQHLCKRLANNGYEVLYVKNNRDAEKTGAVEEAKDMDGSLLGFDILVSNKAFDSINDIENKWQKFNDRKETVVISNSRIQSDKPYYLIRKTTWKTILKDVRDCIRMHKIDRQAIVIKDTLEQTERLGSIKCFQDIASTHNLLMYKEEQQIAFFSKLFPGENILYEKQQKSII